jgi:hypothetical protein
MKNYLLVSASSVAPLPPTDGDTAMALSATAYGITQNRMHLDIYSGVIDRTLRRLTDDSTGAWQNYGNAPSPDYDGLFCLQWPRFKYQLDRLGSTIPTGLETGNWFFPVSRYSGLDFAAPTNWRGTPTQFLDAIRRGAEIYILSDTASQFGITLDANPLIGGDPGATSLFWTKTSGDVTGINGRIPMTQNPKTGENGSGILYIGRPSSWKVYREHYDIPSTGLTKLVLTGGITLYRPLTSMPEMQVLHNRTISDWGGDVITYNLKVCSGVLYPITSNTITMKVVATDPHDTINTYVATHVQVGNTTEWLLPGATGTYSIPGSPTVTPISIFTEGFGNCTIWFTGGPDKLFYFGNLADIQAILPTYNAIHY